MKQLGACVVFSDEELDSFEKLYDRIIYSLKELNEKSMVNMDVATSWMETISNLNIPKGRQNRALIVASAYKVMNENGSMVNREGLELAFVLDWTLEFFHIANLITNNIMDNRVTLNGNLTWHNVRHVGMMAVNDSIILKEMAYKTMQIFFRGKSKLYTELEDLRRNACDKYVLGRGLYEKFSREDNVSNCTLEKYRHIIDFTVGYISFYLPVIYAIKLGDESDEADSLIRSNYLKTILLDIAYYYQLVCDHDKMFDSDEMAAEMTEGDLKFNWFFIKAVDFLKHEDMNLRYLLKCTQRKDLSGMRKVFKERAILKLFLENKITFAMEIFSKIAIIEKTTSNTGLVKFLALLANHVTNL